MIPCICRLNCRHQGSGKASAPVGWEGSTPVTTHVYTIRPLQPHTGESERERYRGMERERGRKRERKRERKEERGRKRETEREREHR